MSIFRIEDIKLYIFDFLNLKEIRNFSLSCKRNLVFFNSDTFWKMYGKANHPNCEINSKKDFFSYPFVILEKDILEYINSFPWLRDVYTMKRINRNNVEDHIVPNMAKNIAKNMLIVDKYRNYRSLDKSDGLLDKNRGLLEKNCRDEKMSVNLMIESHLLLSEEIRNELLQNSIVAQIRI